MSRIFKPFGRRAPAASPAQDAPAAAGESVLAAENEARRKTSEREADSQADVNEARRRASESQAREQAVVNEARRQASDSEARSQAEANESRRRASEERRPPG
jgi:hypothetical protein